MASISQADDDGASTSSSSSCEVDFSSYEVGFSSSEDEVAAKARDPAGAEAERHKRSSDSEGDHEAKGCVDVEDDDDEEDFLASNDEREDEEDDEEEAYRRYEERTSFDHARIEIDENYEEDLGFPMYYAGYTNRKKQLPLGMDCWKVKKIPADAAELRAMVQDQKVRRELLAKVLEEIATEKSRLTDAIAAGV